MPKLSPRKIQSRNSKRNLLQNEQVVHGDDLLVAVPTIGLFYSYNNNNNNNILSLLLYIIDVIIIIIIIII